METKKIIGLGIIAIMILSTVALVMVDFAVGPSSTFKYNGFKFRQMDGQLTAKIDGQQRVFLFFPGDLEYIRIPEDVKSMLQKPVLTVTYDPNSTLSPNMAEAQYYLEVQLQDRKIIERAVTDNDGIELPQKTCAEATEAQPVVEFIESNTSVIKAVGNCIQVQALDAFDLYQQTERLVYSILGVMP
ncbi:MAG: hypothetical protein QW165_02615 [Candidatus Woesearchaeota archaeon]